MAEKLAIQTDEAAVLGGPYPQAVIHHGLVYLSGQGAVDPRTNRVTLGTIEEETEMTLENIRIILEKCGSSMGKILQMTIYLLKMKEYGRFNEVYEQHFQGLLPARTCVQAAGLPFGLRVEIDAIAHL